MCAPPPGAIEQSSKDWSKMKAAVRKWYEERKKKVNLET